MHYRIGAIVRSAVAGVRYAAESPADSEAMPGTNALPRAIRVVHAHCVGGAAAPTPGAIGVYGASLAVVESARAPAAIRIRCA